jgi:hypothetical protein
MGVETDDACLASGVIAGAVALGGPHDVAVAVDPCLGEALVADVSGDVTDAAGCGLGEEEIAGV